MIFIHLPTDNTTYLAILVMTTSIGWLGGFVSGICVGRNADR